VVEVKHGRAFTLTEIIVVIGIVVILSAIAFPVAVESKKRADRAHCVSNLKQMASMLLLYRSEYDGADQGTPAEMGLPNWSFAQLFGNKSPAPCRGHNPKGNDYIRAHPADPYREASLEQWRKDLDKYGGAVIVIYDTNHQDKFPKAFTWGKWSAFGVQLDGTMRNHTNYSLPRSQSWWGDR
jgi:prepilin-type N-terminal cleavage/methylation domain-containing protein